MKKVSVEKEDASLHGQGGCHLDILTSQVLGTDQKQELIALILFSGEGEEAEDEEQRGPELKQASRRDMYTICQSAGLGKTTFCHIDISALNKETFSVMPQWIGTGKNILVTHLRINCRVSINTPPTNHLSIPYLYDYPVSLKFPK